MRHLELCRDHTGAKDQKAGGTGLCIPSAPSNSRQRRFRIPALVKGGVTASSTCTSWISILLLGQPASPPSHTPARKSCWWATRGWARLGWAGGWRMASSRNMRQRTASSFGCWSSFQHGRTVTMRGRALGSGRASRLPAHSRAVSRRCGPGAGALRPHPHDDPLSGVEFWLKQLKVGHQTGRGPPTVLIAARSDRGTPRWTQEELDAFCRQRGIMAYLPTSAMAGEGSTIGGADERPDPLGRQTGHGHHRDLQTHQRLRARAEGKPSTAEDDSDSEELRARLGRVDRPTSGSSPTPRCSPPWATSRTTDTSRA